MENEKLIEEIQRYETEFEGILKRFTRNRAGIYIDRNDDPLFRQYVREIIDLLNDALGQNSYSSQIEQEANNGVNYLGMPSYKSVENILSVVRATLTRLRRNPDILNRREAQRNIRIQNNIFIIHGRDEAKWRELKDIVQTELRLNPIILAEQPDAGCNTIIEKFELYASTCSYAIAVFTPDDEVVFEGMQYLQARPNVIYELGWFCGTLGRSGAMLLLKEGTSIFSDFGGIFQKRFTTNISEKIVEIRRDLVNAGIIDAV